MRCISLRSVQCNNPGHNRMQSSHTTSLTCTLNSRTQMLSRIETLYHCSANSQEIMTSSPSTCSSVAPFIWEAETVVSTEATEPHTHEEPETIATSPKKRKLERGTTFVSSYTEDNDSEENYKKKRKTPQLQGPKTKNVPKKRTFKKNQSACQCGVCNTTTTEHFGVRNDCLWLYTAVFPGVKLSTNDKLCVTCQNKFKTSPCANCHEKGMAYWLPDFKLRDASRAFENNNLKPGRLCYTCGDKLSKYMKKLK